MPSVICSVLSYPFPIVLEGIRPTVFVHRGLMDIFCSLPFLILGLILLHDPMPFLVVADRTYFFRILLCTRYSVSALFLSTSFRFGLPLLCPLQSSIWLDILPWEVLRVERVQADLFLLPIFCLHLVRTFLFRLLVRLPTILRNIHLDILRT